MHVPPGEASRLTYQPALDGIRAIAALAVVGFHLRLPGFSGGALGVDIFFVLSGFLITSILLSELAQNRTISFRRFYARRALRLLPAYFAVVLFAVILYTVLVPVGGTRRGVIASFFYVANWVAAAGAGGLGTLAHTWSLSVEEQFYLVWPLLLLVIFRFARGNRRVILAAISGVLALTWIITLVAVAIGVSFDLLNNATNFRATELLAGCVLAVLAKGSLLSRLAKAPKTSSAAGALSLLGLIGFIVFGEAESHTMLLVTWGGISLCVVVLIASLQHPRKSIVARVLSYKPLVAVGIVSYGIYLWHFPVMVSIDALIGLDSVPAMLLSLVATAVLVVGSYFLIERPFLRLKGRFERAPRGAAE